jgi:uncharacterized protein (DUF433 family)
MPVNLSVEPRSVPLVQDATGRWRVTGTRIPLERIVECHEEGLSPEQIVENYDTLRLADVYSVISYYLDHKEEVGEYLGLWEARAQEVEQMIQTAQPSQPGRKEELLARRYRRGEDNAPTGQ